ncbi:hypothetical protein ACFL2Q_17160 [Thermodesulfobacteriota bacterium]
MKRFFVVVAVIVCCWASTVFAQGLPFASGDCSTGGLCSLNAYVGYAEHHMGTVQGFNYTTGNVQFNDTTRLPLSGLWLGFSGEAQVSDAFGCLLSGGGLVYAQSSGWADVEPDVWSAYSVDSRGEWWGYLDATASYSIGFLGRTSFLVGFRWDHYNSRTAITYGNQPNNDVEMDFKMNAYLPILGAQVTRTWWGGLLRIRAIGFPTVLGEMKYDWGENDAPAGYRYSEVSTQQMSRGYFVELFAEYRRRMTGHSQVGAFVTLNQLHGVTDIGSYNFFEVTQTSGLAQGNDDTGITFQRTSWTVGGSVSLDFNLL